MPTLFAAGPAGRHRPLATSCPLFGVNLKPPGWKGGFAGRAHCRARNRASCNVILSSLVGLRYDASVRWVVGHTRPLDVCALAAVHVTSSASSPIGLNDPLTSGIVHGGAHDTLWETDSVDW